MAMFEIDRPVRRPSKTEVIKRKCVRCHGTGRATCRTCGGKGEMSTSRNALGHMQFCRCRSCHGTKTTRCVSCAGVGWMV